MDYLPDSDQTQIVDAFRDFLSSELPLSRLALEDSARRPDATRWPDLGELGWLAITQDGSGLGIAEEMLIFIEAGKELLSPLLLGSVLGARVLQAGGAAELARQVMSGAQGITPALPLHGASIQTDKLSGDFYLLDAENCEYLLVCTPEASMVAAASDLQYEAQRCMDESVTLTRVSLADCRPVATSQGRLFERALILSAAMLTGVADRAKQLAVDYALERQQFGKPIGAFQTIKHYCADMALRQEAALSLVTQAALEFAEEHTETGFDALAAKLTAATAAVGNAEAAIQIHGAMGFTREMPVHLLLKRAHLLSSLFADEGELIGMLTQTPTPDL